MTMQLTLPLMAALGLGIVWVNTLLVVGAAWQDVRVLRARLARAKAAVGGVVVRGAGLSGAVGVHRVVQTGRAKDAAEPTVVFADRSFASEVFEGALKKDDGTELAIAAASVAEVWPSEAARQRALDVEIDERAYAQARGPKGLGRTLEIRIVPGERAWVVAEGGGPLWVSAIEPAAWCRARIAKVVGFMVATLVIGAAVTAVAFVPPAFGLVSKLGGTGLLAFFLLVQPAGVTVRESVRGEHERYVRGERRASAGGRSVGVKTGAAT